MPKIKVTINPIEKKFCMSHYSHKRIPKSGRFSSVGDMTSPNFPFKKRTSYKFGYLLLENGLNSKKKDFLFPELFSLSQNSTP